MSSVKCWPFCLGPNVARPIVTIDADAIQQRVILSHKNVNDCITKSW